MINILHYSLLFLMTLMGAIAAIYLKMASEFKNIRQLILDKKIYIGGILYFLSALLNIYILRFLEYSIILPMTSITYIWTMIFSYFIFHEKITTKKIIGLGFVFIGVVLIAVV